MKTYSFYDPATGLFDARVISVPDELLQVNTPANRIAKEGYHDCSRCRVDVATGEIVPYQPPAPADTEWATHSWDADAWAWVATPTTAALARSARAERDRRLDATVSVSLKYFRIGQPIPKAWADYMQALADVPEQPGFPTAITWPTPPTSTP